jgi:uncharacterized protein YchJ
MDEGVEQLVIQQMSQVQEWYPNLELQRDPDGQLWVRGAVGFSATHNGRSVEDSYQLELQIPEDYPESPPYVFETEGRVSKDFEHFMASGNFCLEAPVEIRRRFAQHRNLWRFIDEQVVPFLFAASYKRDYGELPFGDRLHGTAGLLQYYIEFFGVSGGPAGTLQEFFDNSGIPAMKLLKCLADAWAPPLMACPCESGRKHRDCHGPKLDELRPHLSQRQFEEELRQMVNAAQQARIDLPESQVMPKRMWKQVQRRLKRSKRRGRRRK